MLEALANLFAALVHLLAAAWFFVVSLLAVVATPPVLPLLLWVAFWLLAVDWTRLRQLLLRGAWVGVLLVLLMTILVWGVVSPPATGYHSVLGLPVSNFVGKTVFVTCLVGIAALCGFLQLIGWARSPSGRGVDPSPGQSRRGH